MKKIIFASSSLALAAAIAAPAAAAPGDTASTNGVASAEIVAPIAIAHDTNAVLDFGTMVTDTAGTVTVTALGVATATGPKLMSGSISSADAFTVSGDNGRSFSIVTGAGTVTSGADTMSFTTVPSAATGTLGATSGEAGFTVGGVLTVAANQAAGAYTGSYSATATYN